MKFINNGICVIFQKEGGFFSIYELFYVSSIVYYELTIITVIIYLRFNVFIGINIYDLNKITILINYTRSTHDCILENIVNPKGTCAYECRAYVSFFTYETFCSAKNNRFNVCKNQGRDNRLRKGT